MAAKVLKNERNTKLYPDFYVKRFGEIKFYIYFCTKICRRMLRITAINLLLLLSLYCPAQQDHTWIDILYRTMTAEDMDEGYGEETLELLATLAENPINLNQTSREELEQLPFLTDSQVEALVAYIDRYGPVRSLSELLMVEALDGDTRRLLQCFVCAGDAAPQRVWPRWRDISDYGRHTLMATAKVPLYNRRGDDNGYLGYKYRHDVRYQFNYNNRIRFGLTAAQDAGEPFFSAQNAWGYDHYSYYFQLRQMGRLEELNVGMYRVQLGQGLLMNTGFQLGKLTTLQSMGRSTHLLTAHASRSVSGYQQGAAATVRVAPSWRVTLFASYRPLDATLNADGTARTLLSDGYHRTPTEMEKKHNTHETDLGGSIGFRRGTLHASVNAVFTHLDRPLYPLKTAANHRYPTEGNDWLNVSLDYGYSHAGWTLSGETAMNREGAIAMLHSVGWRPREDLRLTVLHRFYGIRYTALHARSYSEGGHVQNEHGLYVGALWQPLRSLEWQGYVDYAHFAGPRYQVSVASDAFDLLTALRYTRRQWTWGGRYRLHITQRDDAAGSLLANRVQHRCRLSMAYDFGHGVTLQTQADATHVSSTDKRSSGVMIGQQGQWCWRWLTVHAHVAWFRAPDYDARLYQYERTVRYDFSFPAYYGHGLRYALMASARLGARLVATAKAGVTDYFDRSTISSGLQEVCRSSLTDILLQLQLKL